MVQVAERHAHTKNITLYSNKLYDTKPTVQMVIILSVLLIVCVLF